jgi:hypothetical protein
MADKYHSDTHEKVEAITFTPYVQDTGDLEVATKTITATSKPGTADYDKTLTLAKPSDIRLIVKAIAARLQTTRDSGTSNNLYCTVTVDSADGSSNLLFDAVDVQAAANQAVELTAGAVFDLLSDGAAHTFYFFFWVDSGDSVISQIQLEEGAGNSHSGVPFAFFQIVHSGFFQVEVQMTRKGSATASLRIWNGLYTGASWGNYPMKIGTGIQGSFSDIQYSERYTVKDGATLAGTVSNGSDIACLYSLRVTLRSQQ